MSFFVLYLRSYLYYILLHTRGQFDKSVTSHKVVFWSQVSFHCTWVPSYTGVYTKFQVSLMGRKFLTVFWSRYISITKSWKNMNFAGSWCTAFAWETVKETGEKLVKYYRKSPASHGMVHKWFTEFRCGRIQAQMMLSVLDTENRSLLKKWSIKSIILVLRDRRLEIREISDIVKISTEQVIQIFHECLSMKKLSARLKLESND